MDTQKILRKAMLIIADKGNNLEFSHCETRMKVGSQRVFMTTMVKDRDYSTRENNQLDGFNADIALQHSPGRYCTATRDKMEKRRYCDAAKVNAAYYRGGGQPSHSIGAYRTKQKNRTGIFTSPFTEIVTAKYLYYLT